MASSFAFDAIGTSWKIAIGDELSDAQKDELLRLVLLRIDAYDKAYSRFRTDSIITLIAERAGVYELPSDSEKLFSLYRKMYDVTEGRLTPLIGDVLVTAGYDKEYSLKQSGALVTPLPWDDVFQYKDGTLTVFKETMLDVGAGGKGHLVDLVGELLEEEGVREYTVDAGGDIRTRGEGDALRVGLEHPFSNDEVVGVALLKNQSICGSAGNRRAWGEFHHIIDPRTLRSPRHLSAVWVVAEETFLADLLTTSLFFVEPEKLLQHFSFSYALLDSELRLLASPNFPAEFFTA